jgi:hypothetical protein
MEIKINNYKWEARTPGEWLEFQWDNHINHYRCFGGATDERVLAACADAGDIDAQREVLNRVERGSWFSSYLPAKEVK